MAEDNQNTLPLKTDLSPEERERFAALLRNLGRHAGTCALALEVGQDAAAVQSYLSMTALFMASGDLATKMLDAVKDFGPGETDEIPELIFRKS